MPNLTWIGKKEVERYYKKIPFHSLKKLYYFDSNSPAGGGSDLDEKSSNLTSNQTSKSPKTSQNLIIHADNLLALKSLLPKYEGRIDCIYIDPPYNTGNENWVYNDNTNDPKIKKWLGEVVARDDLSRHDKWLCMMQPRLKLLKQLLSDKGVIFISIDDNEMANLKLLCDEIFGERNFICNFIWKKQGGGKSDSKFVASNCEYILCYKKYNLSEFNKIQKDDSHYRHIDESGRRYHLEKLDFGSLSYSANLDYPIIIDDYTFYPGGNKEKYLQRQNRNFTPKDWCWRCKEEEFWKRYKDGKFIIVENKKTGVKSIQEKIYLSDEGIKGRFETLIDGYTNRLANNQIKDIFGGDRVFTYPKPINLVMDLLKLYPSKNSIILDSFAGSGTTAHAVLELNKSDGGNRKFILIEMNDYAQNITAERVKRAIKGYGKDPSASATGGDFEYYELGERVLDESKNLNENLSLAEILEYIFYTEFRGEFEYDEAKFKANYFVASDENKALYFIYEKGTSTILDIDFALRLQDKQSKVIYADTCAISKAQLKEKNIIFKQIPRDIKDI